MYLEAKAPDSPDLAVGGGEQLFDDVIGHGGSDLE
jgi:hypothetical protein